MNVTGEGPFFVKLIRGGNETKLLRRHTAVTVKGRPHCSGEATKEFDRPREKSSIALRVREKKRKNGQE